MRYKLRYESVCEYEVEAENETEALGKPVPNHGHRCSITVLTKTDPTSNNGS